MNSFKTFMSIFERAVVERNSNTLTEILATGGKYIQNISRDESELLLSILFDKNKGLLTFLNNELKRSNSDRGFDRAVKEGFSFLQFIMNQFHGIFVPYILEIKDTCQCALLTQCSAFIRKAACNVFKDLIQMYSEYDLQLGETVDKFVSKFPLLGIKERSLIFSVLGHIIRHNPELSEMQKHANVIFQQLRNDFQKQFNPQTMYRSIDIFEIYLDVLSTSLIDLPENVVKSYSEELYKWIKELCNPEKYSARKVTLRAAIDLFANNIRTFRELIYCDYKHWHKVLLTVAREKDVRCQWVARTALRRFYIEIGSMLANKISDDDKEVFLYFMNFFENQLKSNRDENSSILPFSALGYSQMASACNKYFGNDRVKEMFSLVAHHALMLCSRDDLEQDDLEGVHNYQDALSGIALHINDLSLDQINVIIKLAILSVKKYPDFSSTSRNYVMLSFTRTVINIGTANKNMLDEFLYHVIHDGVTWTCSHILSVDVNLQELNSSGDPPVCYKDYLYLWTEILKPSRYKSNHDLVQQIGDTMMHVGIVLISKLNLNTKTKEDSVFSDVAFSQIAENPVDFRTFVNIVDLYVDILSTIDCQLLPNTIQKFILKIIGMSYKHPLISGFYKLMRVIFKYLFVLTKDIDAEVIELSCKYLIDVLHLIPTFSNELLTTCLYLVLNTPTEFVKPILNNTIPALKIALTIGLSDFELACSTLDALQTWISKLEKADTNEFLREIVPFLELHLQSGETSVEFLQDILKTERKVIKRIVLKDSTDNLEKFQMKILLFIASLDTEITLDFIYKRSMNVGATWDKKDLLKYSLTFSDTQVDIYFDQILPRLILLAQNSGDRRTKISACEVLHSVVSFILGKTSQYLATNADKFVSIYEMLYPALLNLGCDFDETARNLFQPLILQLTHWLSSNFMLRSPATVYFLDSLFSGLSNESNSSLREFSGICLAEFTKWSIKQSDDDRIVQSNIDEVMYKMTNFALHPSMFKRIAAATAFNHLYTILREDQKVVSTYWLEILYCFVKSLDGCNDISIITALSHVERVLITRKDLLNKKYKNRRKPQEFEDATLTDALNWLLTQCGCLDQCCRAKCMELVVKFSTCLTNCDSAKTMINNYIDTYGIETFNHIILKNLKTKAESFSASGIMSLLRSLDCYIWLMRNNLLEVQYLFGTSNSKREMIFNCAKNFLHLMNRVKIEEGELDVTTLSEELDKLQTLQCKALTTIFDFMQILLSFDEDFIPDFFFNKDLYELIAKCIVCPQVVGFNVKNFEIVEALPLIMGKLLQSITSKAESSLWYMVKCELLIYSEKQLNHFLDFNTIFRGSHNHVALKQYVQGLILLERHNLLEQLDKVTERTKYPEVIIEDIFNILVGRSGAYFTYIRSSTKSYLEVLMEFLFIGYKPSVMKMLITLICDDTKIVRDAKSIECGVYFFHTFKNEILRYMLKDPDATIELLVNHLQGNASLLLTMMEQLFLFTRQHKKEFPDNTQILVNCAIKQFTLFENVVNNFENRKQKLISIFGIAVHLMAKPIEVLSLNKDLYLWILSQLMESSDIKYKIYILQNFLVCLTDMTSNAKPELLAILRNLKQYRLDVGPSDFEKKNIKALETSNYFQTLMSLLPITKSVAIYETVILFAAGIAEQLCNEKTNEYLQKYFASITTEYAVESVTSAYKLFMRLNTATNDRFDILHKFLLPSFQYCKIIEIREFFEKNIKAIYTTICLSLIGNSSDIMQLAVSKIGCYNLITIMFAKIDAQDIDSTESVITRNAIGNVVTGKELIQNLYSNVLNVRMLKAPHPEHKEIIRLLHCSAYNCSITMVSSLKEDEDSYLSIFAENRRNQQLIWENIVDCEKQYRFQQVFDERPKFSKKFINIRRKMKQRKSEQHSNLYSCDFSTCSLTEDINAYDFNETTVRNVPNDNEEPMSLTFESDELNNHECVASICGVLNYIVSEKISVPCSDEENLTMPKWLKAFLNSMTTTDHNNVRLFMLKIIFNAESVFKPYRKFFMEPMMYVMYLYLKENQLNYIILDVIEMLASWKMTDTVKYEFREINGKLTVQHFWEMMIQKVIVERTKEMNGAVYNYNMRVVRLILQLWRPYLKVPENLERKMVTAPAPAIFLIYICLINGMEKDIASRDDVIEFLEKSLDNWQAAEETVLQTFICFGFILNFAKDNESLTNRIIDKIRRTLRQMQTKFENRQIKCINSLCQHYPKAAMIYFEFIPANMFKLDPLGKSNCLEIFLQCIPNFSTDQVLKELAHIKFIEILQNKVLPCEEVALKIINSVVPVLPPLNILPLVNLVPSYTRNESSKYREISYDIFINIYIKYATDISDDSNIKELMLLSTEMLINGVLDPAETIQEKILNFWAENAQLTDTCNERLVQILTKYTPGVGSNFLPFAFLMMLDLTKKSDNYTEILFEPLHSCTYRDYKIALSWRMKNLGSKAPLFAPSLVSQMNSTFTQLSNMSMTYNSNAQLMLQATQEPEFDPTYVDEQSVDEQSVNEPSIYQDNPLVDHDASNHGFNLPIIAPQPSFYKRCSPRFLKNPTDVSGAFRERQIKKNKRHINMVKEESARQRGSIKLYRKYRIGDFPDIEISHATLLEPLQQLATKDQLICKDLVASVVCSLLKESRQNDFVEQIANSLKGIIENGQGSSMMSAILEISLKTHAINYSPEVIAKASRSNDLNFLGSLVLEENIIYGTDAVEPPEKKARTEDTNDSMNEWLQLTNLYQSMNNVDVVLSIFQNHITDEDIRAASFAQLSNNWLKAKVAYEKAYEAESELIKEHCLQGLLECLSNLCSWDEIDTHIKQRLNGDINNIWEHPWKDWMFPWLIEVFARTLVGDHYSSEFRDDINVMQTWLDDEAKLKDIKRFFGEELAMFFLLNSRLEASAEFLINTLDQTREDWIGLHPLSTQLRICKLQKLRVINDVDQYIKTLKSISNTSDLESTIKFWQSSLPSAQDSLLLWDKLTSYRVYFINSILEDRVESNDQDTMDNESQEDENGIKSRLRLITFNMRLKMVEASLDQKQKHIAKKYLQEIETSQPSNECLNQFLLAGAKRKYLLGELETNARKRFLNYASSWEHCHELLRKENLGTVTGIGVRRQISNVASKLVKLSEEDEMFSSLLTTSEIILKDIKAENCDLTAIKTALESYSFNNLMICCNTSTSNRHENYYTFAKYCYEKLSRGASDIQLIREFVRFTLKAMGHGSCEAAHYFPCLLKPEYFEDQETKDIFMRYSEPVPTWLFLSWQAQLFSHLGTSIAPLILPILKRIAETYPNAIIYTFHLTMETNSALMNDTRTYEIRQILYNRPWISQFLTAMQYVVQPELYLQHYLVELLKNLSLGTSTAIDIFMNKVYPNVHGNRNSIKPGSIFNEITKYKNQIKQLEKKKPEEIKRQVARMIESVKESLERRRNRFKLADYSPWLCDFSDKDIEIPGQYIGDKRPVPQNHVKIMRIEPTVKVMQSIRKPIRITILGNDGKEHHFLVKFGEDLRQDQRLQQLFSTMNKILHADPAGRQRQLSIDTYQVIPLSRIVGLIQWVNNTRSLQEAIHYTLTKQEENRYGSIPKQYADWMRNAAPSKKQHEWYKEAVRKYNSLKVTSKMNELISKTKWDGLRKTFSVLCTSVESFVTMRQNFITSYATMCIAHWILGIGDRHLDNTLINIDSGRCLGIDFGLAFDAGVDQRIPELMPFRLTPQILGLLKPFTEKDLLGSIMIHTLRAIRNEQGPILSCMDVFVHEPLNWTEHINKTLRENEEDVTDVKWVPMKKIEAVMKKLNGIKPSLITLDQLKEQHNDQYFDRYRVIVIGDDDIKQTRAKMKDNFLTPEEQVECLLDQATDLNILGRTFVGWKPWL